MSVIVRDEKQQIFILTKGSDDTIFPLLKETDAELQKQLINLSQDGLRTLVLAKRLIPNEEYK